MTHPEIPTAADLERSAEILELAGQDSVAIMLRELAPIVDQMAAIFSGGDASRGLEVLRGMLPPTP